MKKVFLFATFALALISSAFAQSALVISTGTEKGSYHRFMVETKQACPDISISLSPAPNGTVDCMDRLEQNQTSLCLAQADALELYNKTRDMSNVKVVTPLFTEQLHFFTRTNSGLKEGGTGIGSFKYGQKEVSISTVGDLTGRRLAAAGGSFLTAQQFRLQSEIQYQVVEDTAGADSVIEGVKSGKYDAGLLVGAQPLGNLLKAGQELKLLPISADLMAKVSRVYGKAYPLTYRQLYNSTSVSAVGVNSVLVTQNFRSGSAKANQVVALRNCIKTVAEDQAATTGTHPAWRSVAKGDLTTSWPLYEATSTAAPTAAAPTKRK